MHALGGVYVVVRGPSIFLLAVAAAVAVVVATREVVECAIGYADVEESRMCLACCTALEKDVNRATWIASGVRSRCYLAYGGSEFSDAGAGWKPKSRAMDEIRHGGHLIGFRRWLLSTSQILNMYEAKSRSIVTKWQY